MGVQQSQPGTSGGVQQSQASTNAAIAPGYVGPGEAGTNYAAMLGKEYGGIENNTTNRFEDMFSKYVDVANREAGRQASQIASRWAHAAPFTAARTCSSKRTYGRRLRRTSLPRALSSRRRSRTRDRKPWARSSQAKRVWRRLRWAVERRRWPACLRTSCAGRMCRLGQT